MSCVVHLTVVTSWWSMWDLADDAAELALKVSADDGVVHWGDLELGTALVVMAYLLQFPLQRLASFRERADTSCYYAFTYHCVVALGTLGSVLTWRGWWNAYDVVMPRWFPQGTETEYLVTSGVGGFILILLGCLNTAAARGVAIR